MHRRARATCHRQWRSPHTARTRPHPSRRRRANPDRPGDRGTSPAPGGRAAGLARATAPAWVLLWARARSTAARSRAARSTAARSTAARSTAALADVVAPISGSDPRTWRPPRRMHTPPCTRTPRNHPAPPSSPCRWCNGRGRPDTTSSRCRCTCT